MNWYWIACLVVGRIFCGHVGIEVEHHHRIFVRRDVAVECEGSLEGAEFHLDHRCGVWPQQRGITLELFFRKICWAWCNAIDGLHMMGFKVHVNGVPPATAAIFQCPFFCDTNGHGGV